MPRVIAARHDCADMGLFSTPVICADLSALHTQCSRVVPRSDKVSVLRPSNGIEGRFFYLECVSKIP